MPLATLIVPVPVAPLVNVAKYVVPPPTKLDSVPPVTVTSATVKFVEGSDKVKLMFAILLGSKLTLLEDTETVGGVVSVLPPLPPVNAMLTVLLASLPSWLVLPAASENAALATLTVPVPVAPLVKVAE